MSRNRPAATLLGVVLLLAAPAAPALAAPPASAPAPHGSEPDGDTNAARVAHLAGLAARAKGDFAAAREAFLEAWSHKHHWEIAVNLGEAEMKTGHHEEAIEHLTFAVEDRGFLARTPELVEEETARVNGWLAEAREALREASAKARVGAQATSAAATGPVADKAPPAAGSLSPAQEQALSTRWMLGTGAGAGVAVAGLLAGTLMHGLATAELGTVKGSLASMPGSAGDPASVRCAGEAESVCQTNLGRLREADALQVGGTVTLATASVLAAATIALGVLGPKRARFLFGMAPVMSERSAGLVLSGAF